MNKLLLSIFTLISFANCLASDHTRTAVYAAAKLGKISVQHDKSGFAVTHNGCTQQVPNHLVDKELRGRKAPQIAGYLAKKYLVLKPGSDGQFSIKAGTRAEGGGPVLAGWVYSITKGTCYGALATTAAVAVVKTGGAALPAVKGLLGATAVYTSGTVVGTATGLAAVALETGVASTVAIGTEVAVSTAVASGWLAYVPAGIEVLSASAAAVAAWLPTT